MKIQLVKLALASIVIGFAGATWAHTEAETFAATANAVDVWHLECFDDLTGNHADRAVAQVQKTSLAGTLRVTLSGVFDGTVTATNVSATDGSVNGASSAWISQTAADGDNLAIVVSHSSNTANGYSVTGHCEVADAAVGSGTETGTEIYLKSDQ